MSVSGPKPRSKTVEHSFEIRGIKSSFFVLLICFALALCLIFSQENDAPYIDYKIIYTYVHISFH